MKITTPEKYELKKIHKEEAVINQLTNKVILMFINNKFNKLTHISTEYT